MHLVQPWLHALAVVSLVSSVACAAIVVADEVSGRGQKMWIMNIVWPVTMLWAGVIGLIAYFSVGRRPRKASIDSNISSATKPRADTRRFWVSVLIGSTHCGAGCSLADLIVEWLVLAVPVTLFGSRLFGTWLADFVVAFMLGIGFQYFTIAPMKHLSPPAGLLAALKADSLSLSAWQLGMYGWMAIVLFVLYSPATLPKTQPAFWFMMQLAMFAGFVTTYPVNWWLLRTGIKEPM